MSVIKYKDSNGNYRRIEVPTVQRAVMPDVASMPLGTIVQYTGATVGNFVNGYFYKAVESSEIVQVNYYGYAQGSGNYRTDLFIKEGQTDGYYYSSTSSASVMKNLPNFTPLDGSKYVKDGVAYDFEDAPNMSESRVYPYVPDATSVTFKIRLKNGSSYMETSTSDTLERKTSIDTTREETVVTKTWQQINVQPSSAGEAESYNDLTDKPAINGHVLGGNQTNAMLGIGERMDFSTTEREIGTWIDGSTIYEKVIEIGNLPNNNTKRVAHGITYDKIISLSGMAGEVPLPTVSISSSYAIELSIDSTDIVVKTGVDRSSYTGFVIVRYTKVTT